MKQSITFKTILFLSGLIGVAVGGAILFVPVPFYATTGIELGGNINLLNEIRAPGGSLLASGILVMLGAFVDKLAYTSTVVAALAYLSYGLSRILSMAVDGKPATELILVAVLEIIIGLLCVFAFMKYQRTEQPQRAPCV